MSRFDADQDAFKDRVGEFSEREILPVAREIDERDMIPEDLLIQMGEEGLMGIVVPEEFGGLGRELSSCILAIEEVARASPSLALMVTVNNLLTCLPIMSFGTREQGERYLPRLASGDWLGSFALTEPGAGTDAAALTTSATREGDDYILEGEKAFITNMGRSSLATVFARTSDQGTRGISAFLVELPTMGMEMGDPLETTGMRGTVQMGFRMRGLRVPAENILGAEGGGFRLALWSLDRGRLGVAAQCIGIARACLDDAIEHAKRREQFGRPISDFQAIQFRLADMKAELEAARCLTWRSTLRMMGGNSTSSDPAMAKLLASEIAIRASREAMYIMGGRGYLKGCRVERMHRDALITEVYEGTSDVQRMILARDLTRPD